MSWRIAAPLSVLLVLVAGCSATDNAVTMNQSATEIMLALGLQDRIIGTAYLDDQISPDYAEAYGKIPVLAKEYPSKEKLLNTQPDFVYASYSSAFEDEGVGDRAEWQKLGVNTYISPAGCPDQGRPAKLTQNDVFGEIRDIATIFGVRDRAETLIAGQQARIAKAKAATKNTTVLCWDSATDAPSVGACCGESWGCDSSLRPISRGWTFVMSASSGAPRGWKGRRTSVESPPSQGANID
jgi:iron complex transport system substrate-binding protein